MGTKSGRKARRFKLNQIYDDATRADFYINASISTGTVIAELIDISMLGVGFEITSPDSSVVEKIDKEEFDIIVHTPEININSRAKTAWSVIIEDDDKETLKGGFAFLDMPDKEKNKLIEIIKIIGDNA